MGGAHGGAALLPWAIVLVVVLFSLSFACGHVQLHAGPAQGGVQTRQWVISVPVSKFPPVSDDAHFVCVGVFFSNRVMQRQGNRGHFCLRLNGGEIIGFRAVMLSQLNFGTPKTMTHHTISVEKLNFSNTKSFARFSVHQSERGATITSTRDHTSCQWFLALHIKPQSG